MGMGIKWSWTIRSNNIPSNQIFITSSNTWYYMESDESLYYAGKAVQAIKTDGTLWSWGYNDHGQLGLNDVVSYSSPVQVGSEYRFQQVVFIHGMAAL
jgi:hypothetical protein